GLSALRSRATLWRHVRSLRISSRAHSAAGSALTVPPLGAGVSSEISSLFAALDEDRAAFLRASPVDFAAGPDGFVCASRSASCNLRRASSRADVNLLEF